MEIFIPVYRFKRVKGVFFDRKLGGLKGLAVFLLAVFIYGAGFAQQAAGQASAYNIELEDSSVRIFNYRESWLPFFKRVHVISADGIAGRLVLNERNIGDTRFQFSFPVDSLLVDEPLVKTEEQIPGQMEEADRRHFKEKMLGPDVLNGKAHPRVVVLPESIEGKFPEYYVKVRLKIKEVEQIAAFIVRGEKDGDNLRLQGSFDLSQKAFGIEPYSAYLGMVHLKDEIRIKFNFLAKPESS